MNINKEDFFKLVEQDLKAKKLSCKQCNGECFNCLYDRDILCLQIRKELFGESF
jgi:hypothetical protein